MLKPNIQTSRYAPHLFFLAICTLLTWEARGQCPAPILLQAYDIEPTAAWINWTPTGNETSWELAVVPAGSPTPPFPTQASITLLPVYYPGLNAGNAYEVYVRAVCAGVPGSWAKMPGELVTSLVNPSVCGLGLDIPDNDCLLLDLHVSNAPGTAMGSDVFLSEVRFIVEHSWADDVELTLISPGGAAVILTADNGGSQDNYGEPSGSECDSYTAFVHESVPGACDLISIEAGAAPFTGSFLPQESLNALLDGTNPNGVWQVLLCDDAPDDLGLLYYLELVFEPMSCQAPVHTIVQNTDSTFVLLNWTPGTNCTQTFIEYGSPGFTPGTGNQPGVNGTLIAAACPPFLVPNLAPLTDYEFYVREQCADGSFTPNACAASTSTLCSPPPLSSVETFDFEPVCAGSCTASCNLNGAWFNGKNDQMDWFAWNGATPTADTGPDDDVDGGGKYLFLETTGSCSFNARAMLYSNCIDVIAPTGSSCHFSFHYMMHGATINKLELEISDDGGLSWQMLWSTSGNQGKVWLRQYIDLNSWHEQTVQLRFVGFKGFSQQGDIALDNLAFFGPIDLGTPGFNYYADLDMDGYGDPDNSITICSSIAPTGYVDNNLDCFDFSADINPDAAETPCDGIDFNCTGDDDEYIVPAPMVSSVLACDSSSAVLSATPGYGGQVYWYADSAGTEVLHIGNTFEPELPELLPNDGDTLYFYVGEQLFPGCASVVLTTAELIIAPAPLLYIPEQTLSVLCAGETLNLGSLIVQDLNNTGASISFHTALPATNDNELNSLEITLEENTWFYLLASAPTGCMAIDSVQATVSSGPQAQILGLETPCLGETQILTATDAGNGQAPYLYQWSNASQNAQIQVPSSGPVGSNSLYSVTITDSNGCVSIDTISITIVTSIPQVQVAVGDVQSCQGSDGFLNVIPQGGTPPFDYYWSGPQSGSILEQSGAASISNLSQGVYGITVYDSSPEACAFVIPAVFVNSPDVNLALQNVSPVTCAGGSDGCIELQVSGTNPAILWSTGDTTPVLCGLEAGVYSVTVSSGSCSSVLEDIEVSEPDSLVLVPVSISSIACTGGTGSIEVLAGGGSGGYQYLWSTGLEGASILENVPAGYYSVELTDMNGCTTALDSMHLEETADSLSSTFHIEPAPCFGSREGYIEAFPAGGTPPYAFAWSNGYNSALLDFVEAGIYGLTITDALGCQAVYTLELPQPDELNLELTLLQDASCPGLSNGILEAEASGGVPGYNYLWSNGDTTAQTQGLAAGFYALTVTDANGCSQFLLELSLGASDTLNFTSQVQQASCFGVEDGQISITPTQGLAPFQYSWSHGATGAVADSLLYGNYTVSIQDALGCTAELSFEVSAEQPLYTSISAFTPICAQGSNGQIFLTVFDGEGPYQYFWNSGQTTANINGLSAGDYQCSITDARGCILLTDTISLMPPPPIDIQVLGVDSLNCFGDTNGSVFVEVSGGLPPYQYTWSNETTGQHLTQVGPGVYDLTVVDALNCPAVSQAFTFTQPPLLTASVGTSGENIPCEVNNVDTIFAQVGGGSPPYSILWNTGITEHWIAQAPPGEYSFEVVDLYGCTAATGNFKLRPPGPALSLSLLNPVIQNSGCGNTNDPQEVQVLIVGGSSPYQFNWSFGVSGTTSNDTLSYPSLPAGVTSITVTDDDGCIATLSNIEPLVIEELMLSTPPGSITPVACKGDSTGAISIQVQGGLMPYFYFWENEQGDTVGYNAQLSNMPSGVYQVTVIDQLGCVRVRQNLQIQEPATNLVISAQATHNICHGGLSGALNASATGGIAPYMFEWSNGVTQEDQSGMPAGLYSLVVTDFNGCEKTIDSILIQQPEHPLLIDSVALKNVRCNGGNNGSIELFLSGGETPYYYLWSNNKVSSGIYQLLPGSYSCLITDSLGCPVFSPVFTITQPPLLTASTYTEASTENIDGLALVQASGGTPPYSYLWETGATDSLISPVGAGVYGVTVTDANGCSVEQMAEVFFNPTTGTNALQASGAWTVYPNPGNALFHLEGPAMPSPIWMDVFDAQGRRLLEARLPTSALGQYSFRLDQFPSGMYTLRLRSEHREFERIRVVLIKE